MVALIWLSVVCNRCANFLIVVIKIGGVVHMLVYAKGKENIKN